MMLKDRCVNGLGGVECGSWAFVHFNRLSTSKFACH